MIYSELTLAEHCEKYDLEVTSETCSGCNKLFPLNVPIRIKGYAGLEMEKHGCPDRRLAAKFTPISEREKEFWRKIIT